MQHAQFASDVVIVGFLLQKPDMSPQKSDDCGGWSTDRKRINGWRAYLCACLLVSLCTLTYS